MNALSTPTFASRLILLPYLQQKDEWPASGPHIMAQYDEDSIIVYQAYRPSIAKFAIQHQRFGGDFSYSRMSWIKPNFLWMMYRAGWATKEGQEHILAIRIHRPFFDELLESAIASSYAASGLESHETWEKAVAESDVRLQWDPDHDPHGHKLPRRAIQLGLRGEKLRLFGQEQIISTEDITPLVREQHSRLMSSLHDFETPAERPYQPSSPTAALAIGLNR